MRRVGSRRASTATRTRSWYGRDDLRPCGPPSSPPCARPRAARCSWPGPRFQRAGARPRTSCAVGAPATHSVSRMARVGSSRSRIALRSTSSNAGSLSPRFEGGAWRVMSSRKKRVAARPARARLGHAAVGLPACLSSSTARAVASSGGGRERHAMHGSVQIGERASAPLGGGSADAARGLGRDGRRGEYEQEPRGVGRARHLAEEGQAVVVRPLRAVDDHDDRAPIGRASSGARA